MSKKMLFIYNPYSGKSLIKNHLADIVDIFVKAEFEVTIYPTQCKEDALVKVQMEAENYDRIVCSGGDGTLDEVMTGIVRSGANVPVGYIPAGSTNDFAASLGIPKDMVEAAKIAAGDRYFPCDLGDFNGGTFVYVAAFGAFTEVSYETPQNLKNALGHLAYILEGVKALRDIPSYNMEVHHDGQVLYGSFIYGMITNSKSVGGFKGITGPDVELDDGVFEVMLVHTPQNLVELNEILACITARIDFSDKIETFKTSELSIHSKQDVTWTLDGEFGGNKPNVLVTNLHEKVRILV